MEHELRVLVRFNVDLNCASIEVRGCLTRPGCAALLPVIRRARLLSGGMRVVVNLRKARHIDEAALEHLRLLCAEEPLDPADAAEIEAPGSFPVCPVVRVLHNSDAARMAFMQPNPSVLGHGDRGSVLGHGDRGSVLGHGRRGPVVGHGRRGAARREGQEPALREARLEATNPGRGGSTPRRGAPRRNLEPVPARMVP